MEPTVETKIAQVRTTRPSNTTNIQIPASAIARLINNSDTTRPVALWFHPCAMICSLSSAKGSIFLFTLAPLPRSHAFKRDISSPVIVKEHLVNRGIRSPGCRYAAGKIILPHSLKDAIVASGVQGAAFFLKTPEPAQPRVGVVANDILHIQYRQSHAPGEQHRPEPPPVQVPSVAVRSRDGVQGKGRRLWSAPLS